MTKAIILARVSTVRQEKEGLSLKDIQLPILREYAQSKELGVKREFVFSESADRKIRKNFNEMIEFVKDRPGHDRRYEIDWSKAKKELGFQPQDDFDTYLEKTVKWYQDNKDWWQKVKSGEYKEYYQKQYGR